MQMKVELSKENLYCGQYITFATEELFCDFYETFFNTISSILGRIPVKFTTCCLFIIFLY